MNHLVDRLIRLSLDEDVGASGDITTEALVPEGTLGVGTLMAKQALVLSGGAAFARTFALVDAAVRVELLLRDGTRAKPGDVVARLAGPMRSLLVGERTALNILQRTSGIATATAAAVAELGRRGKSQLKVLDTRKTSPGMRSLAKAAVRDGGGFNHRMGLSDGILIKDNHLAALDGDIEAAMARARAHAPLLVRIEMEVASLTQVKRAIAAGADFLLLDNMDDSQLAEAVRVCAAAGVSVEVSGGVTIDRLVRLQALGANYASLGALTHSAPSVDLSLELQLAPRRAPIRRARRRAG